MSAPPDRAAAERELHRLLASAAADLRLLGPEPLMVAAAPHKFNDADHDDYWSAVQVGRHHWEQSQFFSTDSGWRGGGRASEKAEMRWGEGEEPGFGDSRLASAAIAGGRGILSRLERADWRALTAAALRLDVILALIVQHAETWFWVGDPRGWNDGTYYLVHSAGIARFAEEDGRMDHRVGDPDLVLPEKFCPEAIAFLGPIARRRFRPGVVVPEAARELGRRAIEAAKAVRRITRRPVLLQIGEDFASGMRYSDRPPLGWNDPSATTRGLRYHRFTLSQSGGYPNDAAFRQKQAERFASADFPRLLAIATALTEDGFRALFEAATSIDTFGRQELRLLVTPKSLILVYRTALLRIDGDGGLTYVGNIGGPIWLQGEEGDLERIAALDPERVRPPVLPSGGA